MSQLHLCLARQLGCTSVAAALTSSECVRRLVMGRRVGWTLFIGTDAFDGMPYHRN